MAKVPLMLRLIPWLFPKMEAVAPSLAHRYFIHLFYTPFHFKEPDTEKEIIASSKRFSVTVEGKYIQCYKWGTLGPKILFVHGWAGRAGQFRGMIPAFLAKGFQAIAFDGPAHGRSDGKQTNPIEFANAMKAIIDIEKDIHGIIAHSFGGVASIYALSQGLPVTKLITIASPSIAEQVIANYRRTLNASEAAGRAFRNDLMKTHGITFEEISSLHLVKLIKTPLELLLIQDENDPEIAPDNAIELQKVHPSARVLFTKGLGHTRILRDEGVISACLDFLKS